MRIATVGDNNVDTYSDSGISYPGGNCVNVAAYAAINGCESYYIGVLGNDDFGDLSERGLRKIGVDTSCVRRREGLTSRDVIVSENGERVFTRYDRSIIDAHPVELATAELELLSSCDVIHSSIYSRFAEGEFERLCSLGVPVSYDFSVEWKAGARQVHDAEDDVFGFIPADPVMAVCPQIDYAFFSCGHVSVEETEAVLRRAVSLGCRLAVGTRGMEGSYCFDGARMHHQRAYRAPVVDTLGAGDSFITRFLISYLEKRAYLASCETAAGRPFAPEDAAEYSEKALTLALADAALFAARSCSMEGAFGCGEAL